MRRFVALNGVMTEKSDNLLDLLAGRRQPAAGDAGESIDRLAGVLIRQRFQHALGSRRAAHEIARARILADARKLPSIRSKGWRGGVAGALAGLAAGVLVAVILVQPPSRQDSFFSDVVNTSEPLIPEFDSFDTGARLRYVVSTRDVPATASQLAELLGKSGAVFVLRFNADSSAHLAVQPLADVPGELQDALRRLGLVYPAQTTVVLEVVRE